MRRNVNKRKSFLDIRRRKTDKFAQDGTRLGWENSKNTMWLWLASHGLTTNCSRLRSARRRGGGGPDNPLYSL